MDLSYVLTKSADMSFKAFAQLRQMQELPGKFNLEAYIKENDIASASDEPSSDVIKEKISRYNDLKEKIMLQITPSCICFCYYQQESNNHLSGYYFKQFLEAADKALSEPLENLEKIFEQDECKYDVVLATALAIRYGIDKGLLKVEEQ